MTSRSNDFLDRTVGFFRSVWQRGGRQEGAPDPLRSLDPDLSDDDLDRIREQIDDTLYRSPGELRARGKAAHLAENYLLLSDVGQRRFLELLATEYGPDHDRLDAAVSAWRDAPPEGRGTAEASMRDALRSPRARLLQRFTSLDHGVKFVVDLRERVMQLAHDGEAAMSGFDAELLDLLSGWFDFGFLTLERITWEGSPAVVLERLIEYETVHEIATWDDLRNRLGPDRLMYAFFHPRMPNEPVIFVEVALTNSIANSIDALLDGDAPNADPFAVDTAVFYSINNCHTGLVGVPLGDFLIKRVVEELRRDRPNLEQFVTLSPVPGFPAWLQEVLDPSFEGERPALDEVRRRAITNLLSRDDWHLDPDSSEVLKDQLTRLVAHYLLHARDGDQAHDRVANFHLRNGARLERVNWMANRSPAGIERSHGFMVNYRYEPDFIEENHEAYTTAGEVVAARAVRELAGS